ncbi:hypothetical protein [Nocardia goodfellowii]|uniref:Uncharacterized membrane protein YidH (DUF202 family) n=1 Tax=Nocardia goodfellowii TaxID=882446 RepID=A0ABS4QCW2_9NOCA|nr:hypothetical protein [Nocardia goodfellowii]MBP2189541.1 uncharacterized membrane protein YidH (DUF202 family) [Nocardia goodfellowii]
MLFDIRTIVGALLALYGIILSITGLVAFTAEEKAKTGDWNINLWAGLAMLAAGLLFIAWAALRPVVPEQVQVAASDDPLAAPDAREADPFDNK